MPQKCPLFSTGSSQTMVWVLLVVLRVPLVVRRQMYFLCSLVILNQAWTNYSLWARCGPLRILIRSAKIWEKYGED